MEVRPGQLERQMEKRLQAAEMKFMRRTAGLTLWDLKRNEEILKNLKVEPISKFIQNYRANWKEHIKEWILAESQTWEKKPRKAVKKME
jgi:hypothetical protein